MPWGVLAKNWYYCQQHLHQSSSYWQQGSGRWSMEKDDIEEGEVRSGSKDDLDNALPYIDLKLQNVSRRSQKDFEGVVSADIPGYPDLMFAGNPDNSKSEYDGSFLPAQEQPPSRLLQQKTLMQVTSTRAASFKIATTENSNASAELQFANTQK